MAVFPDEQRTNRIDLWPCPKIQERVTWRVIFVEE